MTGPWRVNWLPISYGRRLKASASDLEESSYTDCALRLALKMRFDTWVNANWRRNGPKQIPLGWFMEAIAVLHRQLQSGRPVPDALAAGRAAYAPAHPGLRVFFDTAIENYLDLHESREAVLGPLRYLGHHNELFLDRAETCSLYVWAPMYETVEKHREVRRIRMHEPHTDLTAWAGTAAKIAASYGDVQAGSVSILEVSLADGREHLLLNQATVAQAEALYTETARPRALTVMNGLIPSASSKCAECKATNACREPLPMAGVLQQLSPGIFTRAVSATDLVLYDRCPARWYLERECHLPRDYSEDASADARDRGTATHRWLKAAHSRGLSCSDDDLPEPDFWAADALGADLLEQGQYAAAWPFLRQHVANCSADDGSLIVVDESLVGWDAQADVVVVGVPDLVRQVDQQLIVREVKTTDNALPVSADVARDQFDGVVYWWLSLLAGGWLDHFNCNEGIVELEILRSDASVVYRYSTNDDDLMEIAESRMDARVSDWHTDQTWRAKPNPGCPTCPVRKWCPESDKYSNGSAIEAPF